MPSVTETSYWKCPKGLLEVVVLVGKTRGRKIVVGHGYTRTQKNGCTNVALDPKGLGSEIWQHETTSKIF